jgi:Ca2+-binding EF-hand superfamily protein
MTSRRSITSATGAASDASCRFEPGADAGAMAEGDKIHEILEQSMGFSRDPSVDRDSRALTSEQVAELCQKMGSPLEPEELDEAMDVMDSSGSGSVTMLQFEAWWNSMVQTWLLGKSPDVAGSEFHALVPGGAVISRQCSVLGDSPADPNDPSVRLRLGPNADAYAMFCEFDEDCSGGLDPDELFALAKKMGLSKSMTKKKMKKVFKQLEHVEHGEPQGFVTFDSFADYYNTTQERIRRAKVRYVKELFNAADKDGNGKLDKQEFCRLAVKAQLGLDPPFNVEKDWAMCKKTTARVSDGSEPEVNYSSFEKWWRERLGISAPLLPVLPEHIVGQVEEAARFDMRRRQTEAAREGKQVSGAGKFLWGKHPSGPGPHAPRAGRSSGRCCDRGCSR